MSFCIRRHLGNKQGWKIMPESTTTPMKPEAIREEFETYCDKCPQSAAFPDLAQGCPSGSGIQFVDIKLKVPLKFKILTRSVLTS